MFLVSVAILSVIIGLIRKGSLANIVQSDIKASFLFILALLLFIAVQVGDSAGIAFLTDWMYFIRLTAYCLLLLGIILNLNVWMFILLLGAVMNFVVIFINGGKLPVSESAMQIAGIASSSIQDSSIYALTTAATNFPFLGGIIPIPLPSIFAQIISPGIVLMAVGVFGIIQNILLGIVYEYEDEEDDDDESDETSATEKLSRKEKKALKANQEEDFFYDDDDDTDDDDMDDIGKDYTMGNININETDDDDDDDDDVDESIFTTELPDIENEEGSEENQENSEKSAEEILDEILMREEEPPSESSEAESDELSEEITETEQEDEPAEQDTYVLPFSETDESKQEEQMEEVDDETVPIDDDSLRYANAENIELTPKNDAILQANELIENTQSQNAFNDDLSASVDTDSPFVIVNGRIVENPHYKFKKGTKKESTEGAAQIDSGVYVVRSRNPSLAGKPNFIPPNKRISEPKEQTSHPQHSEKKEVLNTDTGYEKVEMKIGDVQIKFWKKDNEENK